MIEDFTPKLPGGPLEANFKATDKGKTGKQKTKEFFGKFGDKVVGGAKNLHDNAKKNIAKQKAKKHLTNEELQQRIERQRLLAQYKAVKPNAIKSVRRTVAGHRARVISKRVYQARKLELAVQKEQLRQQLPNRGQQPKAAFLSDKSFKSNLSRDKLTNGKKLTGGFFGKPTFKETRKFNLNKSNGGFFR